MVDGATVSAAPSVRKWVDKCPPHCPACAYAKRSGLRLISASQISLFQQCQRRWGWKYIARIAEGPETAAQKTGNETEDQIGKYLTEDRAFDYTKPSGYIAASALAYFPKPKTPGLVLQKHFVIPSPTFIAGAHVGFGYQGYKDLWLPSSALVPGVLDTLGEWLGETVDPRPIDCDFKTTSSISDWAKTEDTLAVDPQAMLYATATMFETRVHESDLAWIYMQTKGAKRAKRTTLRVTREHVKEQFRGLDATACEMHAIRERALRTHTGNPAPTRSQGSMTPLQRSCCRCLRRSACAASTGARAARIRASAT
jgi:hypothetical protein